MTSTPINHANITLDLSTNISIKISIQLHQNFYIKTMLFVWVVFTSQIFTLKYLQTHLKGIMY